MDVRTALRDSVDDAPYTLIVAVDRRSHLEQLLRTARDIVRGTDGQLVVATVIHKHSTSPFLFYDTANILAADTDRQALLDDAVALVDDCPVARHLLVADSVAGAIRSAIDDAEADAVLLGWRDRTSASDRVLGATVDPVTRTAPCDVYIERVGTTANGVDTILLPVLSRAHADPAARLATAIATANDATVIVLAPERPESDNETVRSRVEATDGLLEGVRVETEIIDTDDPAVDLVAIADEHDLVILGADRSGRLRRRVVDPVARAVVGDAEPPVILAKRGGGRSRLARFFGR